MTTGSINPLYTLVTIRGFFRNNGANTATPFGLPEKGLVTINFSRADAAVVERYEVALGSASITTEIASPTGTINVVTKRRVAGAFFDVFRAVGNFDYVRGGVDHNVDLTETSITRFRQIAASQTFGAQFDLFHGAGELTFNTRVADFDGAVDCGFPLCPDGSFPDISREKSFNGGHDSGVFTKRDELFSPLIMTMNSSMG